MQCVFPQTPLEGSHLIDMLNIDVDTLFCLECEHKQPQVHVGSSNAEKHSLDHFLLRLHDSVEAKITRLKSSNKQLDDVKASIHALEGKVDAHQSNMDKQMNHVKVVLEDVAKDMAQDRAMITPFFKTRYTVEPTKGKMDSDETTSEIKSFLVTSASPSPQPEPPVREIEDTTSEAEADEADSVSTASMAPHGTESPREGHHITALESRLGARLTSLESKVEDIMSVMKAVLAAIAQQSNSGGES